MKTRIVLIAFALYKAGAILSGWPAETAAADRIAGQPPAKVIVVPGGDEPFKSSIYRPTASPLKRPSGPIRLGCGPHLFIDDFLIAKSNAYLPFCIAQLLR